MKGFLFTVLHLITSSSNNQIWSQQKFLFLVSCSVEKHGPAFELMFESFIFSDI